MKVRVERCWAGNSKYFFRLILPNGMRESIRSDGNYSDWWSRRYAIQAKDMLCALYGAKRSSIRFEVY